jgi:sugar-specific transcriptional regulator TrmB
MEGGSLFNPGFLGAHFNWWIGQIVSDSTWRDNILPGKFESKDQIPGWGRRYKVRIIGLHDQGETEIPSDQLPWAQLMYPVTGGGGQANAGATANLRQGMFVFGFFLDGQEQQVPVIMGVLGNNAQTSLSTTIGDGKVTNTQPGSLATSGHATPADGNKDPFIKVPDEGLVVNKPKEKAQSEECSPPPPGVSVNEFGLRADKSLNSFQFRDQQSAIAEAEARGLTGTERNNFIQKAVADGITARCKEANSPTSPTAPGATKENVDAVHEVSKADVVRNDYYNRKTVLMSPCNQVKSALKAIQTVIENLTKDIDKVLNTAQSYVDAVSNTLSDIQSLISDAACTIAKYMKIVFDKIKEYVLKQINKALSPTVELLPPNMRFMYADIKETITELISCLYNKITNSLCALIQGLLDQEVKKELPPEEEGKLKSPRTKICSVEKLTGDLIALNMEEMNTGINGVLDNVDQFLNDAQEQIGVVSSAISSGGNIIDSISGSITSALSFENIKLNIFGCDLKPNCATSDFYTLANGGGAAEEPQQPRPSEVDKAAQQTPPTVQPTEKPFAQPSQNQPDIDFGTREEAVQAVQTGQVTFA